MKQKNHPYTGSLTIKKQKSIKKYNVNKEQKSTKKSISTNIQDSPKKLEENDKLSMMKEHIDALIVLINQIT